MKLRDVLLNLKTSLAVAGVLVVCPLAAQTGTPHQVWRCGPLLTNQPQPGQTCEPLSSVSSTVVEGTRVNGLRGVAASPSRASADAREQPSTGGAASVAQQDSARALLHAELREQEQRWLQLQAQWNQGRPVATAQQPVGSPQYLEHVANLRQQLLRSEADLAALRRELARLP